MYIAIYMLMLAGAILVFYFGTRQQKRYLQVGGIVIALLTVFFFWFMNFWGEKLWFDAVGYSDRFWIVWLTQFLVFAIGFILGAVFIFLLTLGTDPGKKWIRISGILLGAVISGFWWSGKWEIILRFLHAVPAGIEEPVLGRDAGFYMFTLPFLDSIYWILLLLGILALLAVIISHTETSENRNSFRFLPFDSYYQLKRYDPLFLSAAVLILILAFGRYLKRFELMFSELGVVAGPGWTDDHIRLPLLLIISLFTALFGIAIVFPVFRKYLKNRFSRNTETSAVLISSGILLGIWIILLGIVPAIFQWLKVEPNEITVEKPYINHNIRFTRYGFHLNKIEEHEYPATDQFTRQTLEENTHLFDNIRLWDYRALDAVFRQFQEIRLYYEFTDVDIDRYTIDDAYREVMVSAREMQINNLPSQSQTFVNRRFKYTHGYGIVLNKVNEFTPQGLPNLLIKDIPPVSQYERLKISRPQIYYGELTNDHVIVNSEESEFDYPSGENNVYNRYEGTGGIQLNNLWRKFLFGWKFDGTRFFFSGYPTDESRLMFHRQIRDRIKTIAPFLYFDDDAYIVLVDGRLYWIVDAYTTSDHFPYSEPFYSMERIEYDDQQDQNIYNRVMQHMQGVNYIRNSVKIIIDAFEGDVDFYVFEPDDPVIRVYDSIFPELFKEREEMPAQLQEHVRYPADMLLVQGLVYTKYHMTDPAVFYNQEDLWVRATEKYYGQVQPVEPYYIMWEQPGSDSMEFVLMLPFTPKNRQVLIGWIAGLCDGENYGRFLSYKFPKDKRILGTQQVETKIDQDSFLSGQLTLWDQRGSRVIRGNVLAIPVSNTMIYVEPIYLQSETAAYPELRLVAVMHNDKLSYAGSFDEALDGLFTATGPGLPSAGEQAIPGGNFRQLIEQARQSFEDYLNQMQQREFENAARSLKNLEEALEQLEELNSPEATEQ
jgi:uncharacterized membrane protein (UPF0182 family)